MARILIPTDFSPYAMHAAKYAAKLLGAEQHTYILLHAYFDLTLSEPMVPSTSQALVDAAMHGMAEFVQGFMERTGAIHVEHEIVLGTLPSAVNAAVERTGAQLVVMGKRGSSKSPFFGSKAIAMIGHCRVPVLVVPETTALKKIERILLADDHTEVVPGELAFLREIAVSNNAEVLIGHVTMEVAGPGPHWSDGPYETALVGVPHHFQSLHATEVVAGLDHFAHRRKVDMIAVLHRHIGLIGRLLHPSVTKDVARVTEIPLLVLEGSDG